MVGQPCSWPKVSRWPSAWRHVGTHPCSGLSTGVKRAPWTGRRAAGGGEGDARESAVPCNHTGHCAPQGRQFPAHLSGGWSQASRAWPNERLLCFQKAQRGALDSGWPGLGPRGLCLSTPQGVSDSSAVNPNCTDVLLWPADRKP